MGFLYLHLFFFTKFSKFLNVYKFKKFNTIKSTYDKRYTIRDKQYHFFLGREFV